MLRAIIRVILVCTIIGGGLGPQFSAARGEVITTFTVDSVMDYPDANLSDGICATITGGNVCTLRAAIQQAASTGGVVEIRFNIPGDAPFTISPASALPNIANASILGPNQSGDLITLNGTTAGAVPGLSIESATTPITVTGLQVQYFSSYGIYISDSLVTIGGDTSDKRNVIIGNTTSGIQISPGGSPVVVIQGNHIGVNAAGTSAIPNGNGIDVRGGGSSNPKVTADSNVISGNTGLGIYIYADKDSGSVIYGNKIGLNSSGMGVVPNGLGGILLRQSSGIQIGNGVPGKGNLITGNLNYGIQLDDSDSIAIQGNVMGATADQMGCFTNYGLDIQGEKSNTITIGGDSPELGNVMMQGLWINGAPNPDPLTFGNVVKNNKLGITATGFMRTVKSGAVGVVMSFASEGMIQSNVITHFDYGVRVAETARGIQIRQNSIYDNGRLGIDLGSNGVTLNDDGDGDSGANGYQNFPILTTIDLRNVAGETYLDLYGSLNSKASMDYVIEIFSGSNCDGSGYGEGKDYVTSVNVTTDGTGNVTWSKTDILSSPATKYIGKCFTTTATEVSSKSTSEFSWGLFSGLRYFLPEISK